jgi:hypothetical protein
MSSETYRCPSARCQEGAELLGIVRNDGTIAYLGQRLTVDESFVQAASEGRSPEKRFRFSDQCVEHGCKQWTGTACSVIDNVIERLSLPAAAQSLPKCSIRPECRWFSQAGRRACAVCPLVITDV